MTEEAGGWILVHRSLFSRSDRYWSESRPRTRWEAWLDLIQMAAHTDHDVLYDGAMLHIRRGQVPTSERKLAERWGWSRKRVRTFLGQLETGTRSVRETAREGAHGLTILTLCNYDTLQHSQNAKGPTEGPTEGPRKAQAVRRDKEGRLPGEKIQELRSRYSAAELDVVDEAFDAFRSTRKTGRMADSIVLRELEYWSQFETHHVIRALQTYLEKDYAGQGRREEYARGILRGVARGNSSPTRSTGPASPNLQHWKPAK